jgi:hypothetical protein
LGFQKRELANTSLLETSWLCFDSIFIEKGLAEQMRQGHPEASV